MRTFLAFSLALAAAPAAWANGGHAIAAHAPPAQDLGVREAGGLVLSARARTDEALEVELLVERPLEPPDPLLGARSPVAGADVTIELWANGGRLGGAETAHAEGEAGVYGAHFAAPPPGRYEVHVRVQAEGGSPVDATFDVEVATAGREPTGHHAMTHPFLAHMGIPDGPGEVSVRASGIRRADGGMAAGDYAVHVEAGIVRRLGLHLRNDAVTGGGMAEEGDHGTELMLQYAFLVDAESTRGASVFAEVSAPTVVGDGYPVRGGLGLSARYLWRTRLLLDGVVHLDPTEGLSALAVEWEVSAQVRPTGRIFVLCEASGELAPDETTLYMLPAVKVGLGDTGGAVGAGLQYPLLADRAFDRQVLFQVDWAF
ncbi:MAG: hypothetical protein ACOZNI_12640 [Myxococcota bacterium]